MYTRELTRSLAWSSAEKKIARKAFDEALERERTAARREVETLLQKSADSAAIWTVRDYLNERAPEIDFKYDYRYSVLVDVFSRLVGERWLTLAELDGLSPDKIALIRAQSERWGKSDA